MVKDQLCKQLCKGSDLSVPVAERTAAELFKTQEFCSLLSTERTHSVLQLPTHSSRPPAFLLLTEQF